MRLCYIGKFVLALSSILVIGCSSSGRMGESEKAVEGFNKTKAQVVNAQKEVDLVLKSLDQLSAGKDLSKDYKAFNSSVADLQKSAEHANKRAAAMRQNLESYVKEWQKEMATVEDPTLKSTLEDRRNAVRANFEQVRSAGQATRDAYQPFITQLQEIQKTLSIDLTPQTVTSIKPAIDKAKTDGQTLKEKLSALQAELDKIAAGMSPSGKASK